MKKYLVFISIIILCFVFAGCDAEKAPEKNADNTTISNQNATNENDNELKGGKQDYFNAEVLAVYDGFIKAKCSEVTSGCISDGAEVIVTKNIVAAKGVPDIKVGDTIRVVYNGVMETYPLQLNTVFAVYLVDDTGNVIP